MSEILAVIASFIHVGTLSRYFWQVRSGSSTPNPTTWIILVTISLMNAYSYFKVVGGNWFDTGITIVTAAGVSVIFIYTLFYGKFGKVGNTEVVSFFLALLIGVFWKMTGNAILANFFLQGVLVVAHYPTAKGLLRGELKENPVAWCIAITAYSFQTLAILAGWETNNDWIQLVHPVLVGIGVIIIFKISRTTPQR
jgi:hypothetical protein